VAEKGLMKIHIV